ncbi:MAG: hypothetical protein ACR2IF_13750 [Terriglobales bacterium]
MATSPALPGTARSRRAPGKVVSLKKGEVTSPLDPTLPDFDYYASMTEDDRAKHMKQVLARDEDEALAIITPVFKRFKSFAEVFQVYRPMIEELKTHFCQPGRPQQGKKTWAHIVEENFGVGIRWMQQLLAAPKESQPKSEPESEPEDTVVTAPASEPPCQVTPRKQTPSKDVDRQQVLQAADRLFAKCDTVNGYAKVVRNFCKQLVELRADQFDGYVVRVNVEVLEIKDSGRVQ